MSCEIASSKLSVRAQSEDVWAHRRKLTSDFKQNWKETESEKKEE